MADGGRDRQGVKPDFAWTAALLAGFGVLRRERRALVVWMLVGLVLGVADQVIGVNSQILQTTGHEQSWLLPVFSLTRGLVGLVAMAIFSAAIYRSVLWPEGDARSRLRFGPDEVRLLLAWLSEGLLLVGLAILSVLPAILFSAGHLRVSLMAQAIVNGLVILAAMVVALVLIIRLATVAPMAVADGWWSFAAGWRLTRGRFWKIFSLYLVLLVAVAVVYGVWIGLYSVFSQAVTGFATYPRVDEASFAQLLKPARVILTVLTAGLDTVLAVLIHAPAAVLYRDLTGAGPTDQAAVFD